MADEASNVETDVNEPEVEQSTEAVVDQPTTEESSTEEVKTEDAKEESPDGADDTEADATEPPADAEASEEEAPKPRTAEARKEALNNEIRDLVSKRNVLRDEIAAKNAAVYAPQTAEDLIADGEDPALARIQAMEQRQELTEFTARVTDLNANLNIESLQVLSDFAWANPEAPEYDQALAERAAATYQKFAGIQTDPQTGLIIAANALPYDIYKAFDDTRATSTQSGQVKGQAAAEKMLAAADTPSSAAPKPVAEDPFRKALLGL